MKKLISLLLLSLTMIALVACGGGKTNDTKSEAPVETSGDTSAEAQETGETKKGETLIIGTEAGFAPYEYIGDDGKVQGVDMDIVNAIGEKLGVDVEIKDMDFDGALLAVQSGRVDMVAAGVSITEDRKAQMDFSDFYVDSTEVVVVSVANPGVEAPTNDALNGKIIGVQQGNIADLYVSDPEKTKPAEIKRYTKFVQAAEDLKNGKIDGIVMDQLPAQELVAANEGVLKILEGDPLFVDQYAIAVKKGNDELLNKINPIIKELKESGKIEGFILNHTR